MKINDKVQTACRPHLFCRKKEPALFSVWTWSFLPIFEGVLFSTQVLCCRVWCRMWSRNCCSSVSSITHLWNEVHKINDADKTTAQRLSLGALPSHVSPRLTLAVRMHCDVQSIHNKITALLFEHILHISIK